MIVLGIETSCDETSVAVVCDTPTPRILSNVTRTQLNEHTLYGGVVPEIAARAHIEHIDPIVSKALDDANMTLTDIDGIAATSGPGLIGGVMVGMMVAKGLAQATNKPFIAINHLEGHALTARLSDNISFPYLLLLVSGGHTQFVLVKNIGDYHLLGTTIDDALGEAFDKTAKMLNLPHPGGPNLEKTAGQADPELMPDFRLPSPLKGQQNCNFSFSGLKTAVRQIIERQPTPLSANFQQTIALEFHRVVIDVIQDRLKKAMALCPPSCRQLVVAGGVAANGYIRASLETQTKKKNWTFIAPPLNLCTDNGAMIAWAGLERLRHGKTTNLDFRARPRWPLEDLNDKKI